MVKVPAKRTKSAPAPPPPPPSKDKAKAAPAKAASKKKAMTMEDNLLAIIAASGGDDILLGDDENLLWAKPVYWLSCGSVAVDKICSPPGAPPVGTFPSGRLTEIYGPNSVGKTTLLLGGMADCQRKGGVVVYGETENALDLRRARALGVDPSKIIFIRGKKVKEDANVATILKSILTVEAFFERALYYAVELRKLLGPGVPILIAWDSIAGTPTIAEMEAKAEDAGNLRSIAAKIIRAQIRRACAIFAAQQVCFICTNQVYKTQHGTSYAEGHETYGGDGPKYYASMRLDLFPLWFVHPRGYNKETDKGIPPLGRIVSVRTVKNKLAPPHKSRLFAIIYDETGIDNTWSIWNDFAGEHPMPSANPAILDHGSGWYGLAEDLGDFKKWQGKHWGLRDLVSSGEYPALWAQLIERYNALP